MAIKIYDNSFVKLEHFDIYNDRSYSVWFIPVGHDEKIVVMSVYTNYIIPNLDNERQRLVACINSHRPIANHVDESDLRADITLDGAYSQINDFIEYLASSTCAMHDIELIKWAAASSMVQQPLDAGTMHRTVKQAIKLYDYSIIPEPSTHLKLFIDKTLNTSLLSAPSKVTFSKFILHMESMIGKGYSHECIKKAWKITGYVPLVPSKILSGCSGWNDLPLDQKEKVLSILPRLKPIAREHGKISDQEINEAMVAAGANMDLFSPPRLVGDVTTSMDRCIWFNHSQYIQKVYSRIQEKETKAAEAAIALDARREKQDAAREERATSIAMGRPPNRVTAYKCPGPNCQAKFTTSNVNHQGFWTACEYPSCTKWFCKREECIDAHEAHALVCTHKTKSSAASSAARSYDLF
jgi:hypothetical protein